MHLPEWLFARRKKMTMKKLAVTKSNTDIAIPIVKQFSRDRPACSALHKTTGLCVCMDCPRLGTCKIEAISDKIRDEKGNCIRFIRSCSVRSRDKGEDPGCASHILEEFNEMLDFKYLR